MRISSPHAPPLRSGARAAAVAGVLALGLCAPAWADAELWGYIDAQGRPHYADRQIDNRYRLFNTGSAPVRRLPRAAATAPAGQPASFALSTGYRSVQHLIGEAASQHGLDFELLQAVIATESGFDPEAVSPKGAVGLMQLMPDTAERFGVRPQGRQSVSDRLTDPRTNIQAGSRYLAWLINTFGGDLRLAVAAYNAGEGAVLKAGRQIPNYPETIAYVRKVTDLHQRLKPLRAVDQARAGAMPAAASLPAPLPGRG